MARPITLPTKLPEWTADLPDSAFLGTNEVASVLGCGRNTVRRLMSAGVMPKPFYKQLPKFDGQVHPAKTHPRRKARYLWRLGDIRKLILEAKPNEPLTGAKYNG